MPGNPQFVALAAVEIFGARSSGIGVWNWADFPSQAAAEQFALSCALAGHGVYFSRTFAERNRVMVNPSWRQGQ